jgi:hypothetical protein
MIRKTSGQTMIDLSANSTVPLGPLLFWMAVLTVKHVLCDFFLQTPWMALGKDAPTGWAKPLLVHCSIHGAMATAILLLLAPRFWFLGLVDFAIHLCADRAKGYCVARFSLTSRDSWFWWLLGIDQAIHHLTDFGLALFLAMRA